jgi:hypothetical protein
MGLSAFGPGRDHGLDAELAQGVVEVVGVVGLVGEDGGRLEAVDEGGGLDHVAAVARREDQADRQSERVDAGVDLGPEPAARAAKALGLRPPFLRAAPAACA